MIEVQQQQQQQQGVDNPAMSDVEINWFYMKKYENKHFWNSISPN